MKKQIITLSTFLIRPQVILIVYFLLALLASLHKVLLGADVLNGLSYTHYNNFIIFKNSFFHLLHGKDLYVLYPAEQWDLYKYSPFFSLLMGPLACFPAQVGAVLWNLLNTLLVVMAVRSLPVVSDKNKTLILWFILLEFITSIQSFQSNGLMLALMLFAFTSFENKKPIWAAVFLVLGVYVKLFSLVGFLLMVFYPQKLKFVMAAFISALIFALLPLSIVSWQQLQDLYISWFHLLQQDETISYGISVMGWLHSWFNINNYKLIMMTGTALMVLPVVIYQISKKIIQPVLFLSAILLWVIIFNHKAESPTFIIAVAGVALWYFVSARTTINLILLWLVIVFTMLSPTDLFPPVVRKQFFEPYVIKVIPCILVWCKIMYDLLRMEKPKGFSEG